MPMYASSRPSSKPLAPERAVRGVDARDQSLRRRFLVARRAVDLAGEKQSADTLGFEPARQLRRLDEVVFDGVAGTKQHRVLEPGQRVHQLGLHVARQAHRKAVDVDLARVDPFGLEENLVPLLVRETDDLVFERGSSADRCRESDR